MGFGAGLVGFLVGVLGGRGCAHCHSGDSRSPESLLLVAPARVRLTACGRGGWGDCGCGGAGVVARGLWPGAGVAAGTACGGDGRVGENAGSRHSVRLENKEA